MIVLLCQIIYSMSLVCVTPTEIIREWWSDTEHSDVDSSSDGRLSSSVISLVMPPPLKRPKPNLFSQSSFSKMDVEESSKMDVENSDKMDEEDSGGQKSMGM